VIYRAFVEVSGDKEQSSSEAPALKRRKTEDAKM
jgi:hypothetical protein